MSQTVKQSAVETVASTFIGFGVSYVAALVVLPIFGFAVTAGPALGITTIYTVISLVRGMLVRRLFNRLHGGTA